MNMSESFDIHPSVVIHPSAIVEEGARIGAHTRIWHHCHIRAGAIIGQRCNLGKNVFVDSGAILGDGVKIQNNVSVYNGVVIEDDVFVGPSAVFTNDRVPRAFLPFSPEKISPTRICQGASLGANCTIRCGSTVGAYALIALGSVVLDSPQPYELWAGNPARCIGHVDRDGNRIEKNG
jgi:UDP-2-acetamido-3-amino-2,3-dideoxy-glucuronate N-acetyltransferase